MINLEKKRVFNSLKMYGNLAYRISKKQLTRIKMNGECNTHEHNPVRVFLLFSGLNTMKALILDRKPCRL